MSRKLSEELDRDSQRILKFWHPNLNLDKIKITHGGIIAWFFARFFKAAAVTLGKTIHFAQEPDLRLLIHELKHIEQQEEIGTARFYAEYIIDWIRAGFKDGPTLPLEEPAYKIEREFLESNNLR